MTVKGLKVFLEIEIENLKDEQREFTKKFDENPTRALAWADDVFFSAAKLEVYNDLINSINNNDLIEIDVIKNVYLQKIIIKASSPETSTSPCSNLVDRFRLKAITELYEDFLSTLEL